MANQESSSRSSRRTSRAETTSFLDAAHPIDFVSDLCLVGTLFAVPLTMGGRGDVGKLVLVTLVVLATLTFAARRLMSGGLRWQWTGTEVLLSLGLLLVLAQLVPLDNSIVRRISPEIVRLFDGRDALGLPAQTTLTTNAYATRGALSVYLAYVLFFYLLVHRLHSFHDVGKVLRSIACITMLLAAIGLLQRFAGNGRFLWLYQHPLRDTYGSVKGTFSNPNHFAHFMALGLGCIIWWWLDGMSQRRGKNEDRLATKLLPCGIALVLFASLLSFSRGGCLVIGCVMTVSAVSWWTLNRLEWRSVAVMGLIGIPVVIGLGIYGFSPLATELGSLKDVNNVQEVANGRQALWSALREGGEKFVWSGSGVGTHQDIYPVYLEEHFEFNFSHGESGYLQLFIEAGLPAILLLLFGIVLASRWLIAAFRGRMTASCMAAAIAPALIATLVHSFFDFVWYLSGTMVVTIAILACLVRVVQIEKANTSQEPHLATPRSWQRVAMPTAWCLAASAALLGALLMKDRLPRALAAPHWDQYVRLSSAAVGDEPREIQRDRFANMYRHLAAAIRADSLNPRTRLRLATVCLKRFDLEQVFADNSMTLGQIREAAEMSHFKDSTALNAWLSRAFGGSAELLQIAREQATLAAMRAPLSGTAYLHLAELDFLTPEHSVRTDAYIRQASLVRPHDAAVRFALGGVFARNGQLDKAVEHWKAAFQREEETRIRIIQNVAPEVSAALFIHMFEPETPDLGRLLALYNELNNRQEANFVAMKYAAALENDARQQQGKAAANIWWIAQSVYAQLGNESRRTYTVAKAVDADPNDIVKRKTLAGLYFAQNMYEQALTEYQWCVQRAPQDIDVKRLASEASLRASIPQQAKQSEDAPLRH